MSSVQSVFLDVVFTVVFTSRVLSHFWFAALNSLPPPKRKCFCRFLFVCLSVCDQNNWTDLSEILRVCRAWHKLQVVQFWEWSGRNPGSLWNFRYHCVKGGIREPLAKWIWWRHLANNIVLAKVPAGYDCFLVVNLTAVFCAQMLHDKLYRNCVHLLALIQRRSPLQFARHFDATHRTAETAFCPLIFDPPQTFQNVFRKPRVRDAYV